MLRRGDLRFIVAVMFLYGTAAHAQESLVAGDESGDKSVETTAGNDEQVVVDDHQSIGAEKKDGQSADSRPEKEVPASAQSEEVVNTGEVATPVGLHASVETVKMKSDTDNDADRQTDGKAEVRGKNRFLTKISKKSKHDIKGRVFAWYKFTDVAGDPNQFEIDVARLNFSFEYDRVLQAVLEYDFAGLIDGDEVKDGLRDAYVRLAPTKYFGIQAGRFKKPFSRLELMSRRRLPTVSRGEANDYAIGFLGYGGRDTGAMISGRLLKNIRLDYFAGVFNGGTGGGADSVKVQSDSLDYVFRLESRPVKWLKLGVAASAHRVKKEDYGEFFDPYAYENLEDDDFPIWLNAPIDNYEQYATARFAEMYPWLSGTHWMGEFDVALKFGGLEATMELMGGNNWWFQYSPNMWSASAVIGYQFPLFGGVMAVEPVILGEVLSIDDEDWAWRARMFQLTPGVNVHFGKDVRLMVHAQFAKTSPDKNAESEIDEAPLRGFWPGEWPGSFEGYRTLFIQLGFAN